MTTYTLTSFLQEKGLMDWFRKEVLPYLLYLQATLGAGFLQNAGRKVKSLGGHGHWAGSLSEREYGTLHWTPTGGNIPLQNREVSTFAPKANPFDERNSEAFNRNALAEYLRNLERALLGSHGQPGEPHTTSHPKEDARVPEDLITPFAALLDQGQVDTGEGGRPGGFDPLGSYRPYRLPIDGKQRRFSPEMLDRMIMRAYDAHGSSAVVVAEGSANNEGVEFEDGVYEFLHRYIILAGRRLLQSQPLVKQIGREQDLPSSLTYGGHPPLVYLGPTAPIPPARIFFPHLMPQDAIYIIAPRRVCIDAKVFCEIQMDQEGRRIQSITSRVAHTLLHLREQDIPPHTSFSDRGGVYESTHVEKDSLGLKEGQGAILAVVP